MHYNLLFNGCSFTWGAELEGFNFDFEYTFSHRFSHIIGKKTNKTFENIASSGVSNDRIARTTIEWFENGNTCDIAIIQFTTLLRTEFISGMTGDLYTSLDISDHLSLIDRPGAPIDSDELHKSFNEYYKNFYNLNYGLNNFYKNLFILETYFEKKNIPHYFIQLAYPEDMKMCKDVPWKFLCKTNYLNIPRINGDILCERYRNKKNYRQEDYAPDYSHKNPTLTGTHPSALGHQKIAEYIIKNAKL